MSSLEQIVSLRQNIHTLCQSINTLLGLLNERMAADPSFVFTDEYRELKLEVRNKNEELAKLKLQREDLHHCYSVIVKGDIIKSNGSVVKDYPLNHELISTIDCNLGTATQLSTSEGSHNALMTLIRTRLASFFVNRQFRLAYIVQMR